MSEESQEKSSSGATGEVVQGVPQPVFDLWQVAVFGAIDPRQHSPVWYKLICAISEAESPRAMGTFAIAPDHISFDAGPFAVLAYVDRLEIQTITAANRKRIADVAEVVFRRLTEIPIQTIKIAAVLNLKTKSTNAREILVGKIIGADCGFSSADADGDPMCEVIYTKVATNSGTIISVGTANARKDVISIGFNRIYPIPVRQGQFDISEMLHKFSNEGWNAAGEFAAKVANRIDQAVEVGHGN
ncbi:MAG: hypothetical protein ABSB33_08370 [Tepidisphaeraceae bacterium]|jgi:hypothetical protein